MTREEIIDTLRDFFVKSTPDRTLELEDGTDLFDVRVIDSLGMISLVMFIESNFGISLAYDDMTEDNFRSLNTIAAFIGSRNDRAPA
jgi:acyl carrier protein